MPRIAPRHPLTVGTSPSWLRISPGAARCDQCVHGHSPYLPPLAREHPSCFRIFRYSQLLLELDSHPKRSYHFYKGFVDSQPLGTWLFAFCRSSRCTGALSSLCGGRYFDHLVAHRNNCEILIRPLLETLCRCRGTLCVAS